MASADDAANGHAYAAWLAQARPSSRDTPLLVDPLVGARHPAFLSAQPALEPTPPKRETYFLQPLLPFLVRPLPYLWQYVLEFPGLHLVSYRTDTDACTPPRFACPALLKF